MTMDKTLNNVIEDPFILKSSLQLFLLTFKLFMVIVLIPPT